MLMGLAAGCRRRTTMRTWPTSSCTQTQGGPPAAASPGGVTTLNTPSGSSCFLVSVAERHFIPRRNAVGDVSVGSTLTSSAMAPPYDAQRLLPALTCTARRTARLAIVIKRAAR